MAESKKDAEGRKHKKKKQKTQRPEFESVLLVTPTGKKVMIKRPWGR